MMRIAIASPYATVAPHYETELELAQRHLDAGDRVAFWHCTGGLANCDFNPTGSRSRCQECIGRRLAGYPWLEGRIELAEISETPPLDVRTEFASVDQLIGYTIDEFDIGYAALSSLVSLVRDPEPDLQEHRDLLRKLLVSAASTYQFTRGQLAHDAPDRVYVFNGRFANMRAVLRACQREGVDCWIHERGCDNEHYELFPNHLPHDIQRIQHRIRQMWQDGGPQRERLGQQWFHDRVQRVESNWHSFVKDQRLGRLPSDWDASRENVAIFCSSDDEFVAIGDCWKNPMYTDQLSGIIQIVDDLANAKPDFHVYLRMHPNLRGVENRRTAAMRYLQRPNLTVIDPEDDIDTYALMRAVDKVITFGSSVGIEATFWGTPSILLGPCFYRGLGSAYEPSSHDEAVRLILADLSPQDRTGALMYGFWLKTRGIRYRDYEPTGLFEGKFKGQIVHAGMKPPRRGLAGVGRRTSRWWNRFRGGSHAASSPQQNSSILWPPAGD